jgi:hypothetical protein
VLEHISLTRNNFQLSIRTFSNLETNQNAGLQQFPQTENNFLCRLEPVSNLETTHNVGLEHISLTRNNFQCRPGNVSNLNQFSMKTIILFFGTPTKRQDSKRLKRQVYKMSGLLNVRFTKCQVYKTSGLPNVRFQKNIHVQYILYLWLVVIRRFYCSHVFYSLFYYRFFAIFHHNRL